MKKRILSVVLCLCMVLGMMPAVAFASGGSLAASVWIGGVELTADTPYLAINGTQAQAARPSGGYAYFNRTNGKLTLSSFAPSQTLANHVDGTVGGAVYADGDLELVLTGTSNIKNSSIGFDNGTNIKYGVIYCSGELTISGNGTLTNDAYALEDSNRSKVAAYGIYAGESMTINSCTLNITAPSATGTQAESYGLYSGGTLDINDGSRVTAKGGSAVVGNSQLGYITCSIYAARDLNVYDGSEVTAECPIFSNGSYAQNSWGIAGGGDINIMGKVTAKGYSTANGAAIYAADGTIDISENAEVTAWFKYGSSIPAGSVILGKAVSIADAAAVTLNDSSSGNAKYGIYGSETVTLGGDSSTAVITISSNRTDMDVYKAVEAGTLTASYGTLTGGSQSGNAISQETINVPVYIDCDTNVKISFDPCNGQEDTVIKTADISTLPQPTWSGYNFEGWYAVPNGEADYEGQYEAGQSFAGDGVFTTKLTAASAAAIDTSRTVYARWSKNGKTVRTTPLEKAVLGDAIAEGNTVDKLQTQGWSWSNDTNILTLSGAYIVCDKAAALSFDGGSEKSLEIFLATGSSNLISNGLYRSNVTNSEAIGIKYEGKYPLTISGDGSLKVQSGTARISYGISGNVQLYNVDVTASAGAAGDESKGICGNATANDGASLTASGSTATGSSISTSIGIYGDVTGTDTAVITARGGDATSESCGITGGVSVLDEASVSAQGGAAKSSKGINLVKGIGEYKDLSVDASSSVVAAGGTAAESSYGVFSLISGSSSIRVSGNLTAKGGSSANASFGVVALLCELGESGTLSTQADATAIYHADVFTQSCTGGGTLNCSNLMVTGVDISDSLIVYGNSTLRGDNYKLELFDLSYTDKLGSRIGKVQSLTVKPGATLTLAAGARLSVNDLSGIFFEPENENASKGAIVNNGILYIETAPGSGTTATDIAALNITGEGMIQVVNTLYYNDGTTVSNTSNGDLDLTENTESVTDAEGVFTYETVENVPTLIVTAGAVINGNVSMPATDSAIILEDGAVILGKIETNTTTDTKCTLSIAKGKTAVIQGGIGNINISGNDESLTIEGGGTLDVYGKILINFDENGSGELNLAGATTLNVTTPDLSSVGVVTKNLKIDGALNIHAGGVSVKGGSMNIGAGGSVSVNCINGAVLNSGFTIERGGTFSAAAEQTALIVTGANGINLPSNYLPRGYGIVNIHSSSFADDIITIAANGVQVSERNDSATENPRLQGAASTVTLKQYSYGGGGGSAVVTSGAVTPSAVMPFTDVKEGAYYYDAVLWATDKSITSGTTATTFSPKDACTRGQLLTFLWRAMGSPEPAKTVNPFTDVKETAYYYKAVMWAVEKGITTGATATTFNPKGTVSRSETVAFMWRAAGMPAFEGSNSFADVKDSAYYADAVRWAVKEGITEGMTKESFGPSSPCTRGQIVTFLYRYLGKTK